MKRWQSLWILLAALLLVAGCTGDDSTYDAAVDAGKDTAAGDATGGDSTTPDTAAPDTTPSDTSASDSLVADGAESGTGAPDSSELDTSEPGADSAPSDGAPADSSTDTGPVVDSAVTDGNATDSSPADSGFDASEPIDAPAGDAATYAISVTVTGLAAGSSVTLENEGANPLVVTSNTTVDFAGSVADGAAYDVTVSAQPTAPAQTCTVSGGTGVVSGSSPSAVIVNCGSGGSYTVGGTVSGLHSQDVLQLSLDGGAALFVSANGAFAFPTALANGASYTVAVVANPLVPVAQTCAVGMGTGAVAGANVNTITVTCTVSSFTIGGTVAGLVAGGSVTLEDNGGSPLVVAANGAFTFATPVASGQTYQVTVQVHPTYPPAAQTCALAAATGTVASADVTSVTVTCTTTKLAVGGTVTGLASGESVTLTDNGAFDTVVATGTGSASQPFQFTKNVASGSAYAVAVESSPASPLAQSCVVTSGGTGIVPGAAITSVQITCTTTGYVVTTMADSGAGSLRAVVAVAENGATITFAPSLTGQTIALLSPLVLPKSVTIQGPTTGTLSLTGGGGSSTVQVLPSATASLANLTFAAGSAASGGAVNDQGALTVTACTFTGNAALLAGGAIAASGALTVSASTFSGNSAGTGGAIDASAALTVTNSTFSGNSSASAGGAVAVEASGSAQLVSVTIAGSGGPGALASLGSCTLKNSIVFNGAGDLSGTFTSGNYNLIGSTTGATLTPASGDQIGVDPMLEPLGGYGGPTQTMALPAASPAVGAVPLASCTDALGNPVTVDQRGAPRPTASACDVGAVERQPSDP